MRIVSLLPAATEIAFAIGLGSDVVGVSPECDYPAPARHLPRMSHTRLTGEHASSAETSRRVGERLASGEGLYEIDEDGLTEARPDVILTQALCEVCAPMVSDVRAASSHLAKKPKVVSLDPHSLRDVLEDIDRVGKACGAAVAASNVVEDLRDRIERVAFLTAHAHERPRTLCLDWLDPLFIAGHWVPEMVELAGGVDALGTRQERSHRVDPKDIVLANPDVAVLMPCGFDIARTADEAPAVTKQGWWFDLPAARRGRVWIVDGSSYFNRPGPRLVTGLEILGHILHPEIFPRPPSSKDARPWVG